MPTWVKGFVVAGLVALLVVLVVLLSSGGHGPARHQAAAAETDAPTGPTAPEAG